MPKPFSPDEAIAIKEKLFRAGLKRFACQGVRAVRVDDLCSDVGIAKGSFYRFFSSKEELFMCIAQQRDDQHKKDMRAFLNHQTGTRKHHIGGFFDMIMDKIRTDPMMQLMIEHDEAEYLLRKIPFELIEKNAKEDSLFLEELTSTLHTDAEEHTFDADTIEGLMTLAVSLHMQHRMIPPHQLATATAVLKKNFIDRLI